MSLPDILNVYNFPPEIHDLTDFPSLYPYAGLSVGVQFADSFDDDEYSLVFIPRVGLKWFLRDYIAIDTNLFLALATDEVYVNDRDTERWDLGIRIGLRVFFN